MVQSLFFLKGSRPKVLYRRFTEILFLQLALSDGRDHEKDEFRANTASCCSLRVEHIQFNEEKNGSFFLIINI